MYFSPYIFKSFLLFAKVNDEPAFSHHERCISPNDSLLSNMAKNGGFCHIRFAVIHGWQWVFCINLLYNLMKVDIKK